VNEEAQAQQRSAAIPGSVGALMGELAELLGHWTRGTRGPRFSQREALEEGREIVAALYDVPRFWPTANTNAPVESEMRQRARDAAVKRARGAPLAYAVGRAAFRHLTLDVDERVLIPRPETEVLVDLVLERAQGRHDLVVDVGTGCGAIALALATEGPFVEVLATDVSLDALAVAEANARMLQSCGALRARVSLAHGAYLAPLRRRRATVVVSNPPYIAYDEARDLPSDVRDWEPAVALFSGAQGLDASARLAHDAADALVSGGLFAMEVDARRASLVAELVARDARFVNVSVHLDLAGRERFVLAERR
jgi:release factor glutamine methyltransferase